MAEKISDALVTKAAQYIKKYGKAKWLELKNTEQFDLIAKHCKVTLPPADAIVYRAEPVAFPDLKIKASGPQAKQARNAGLRWERIAARMDVSVAEVKKLFAESGGDLATSYIGRGRMPSGVSPAPKKTTAKKGTAAKKTTAAKGKKVVVRNRKKASLAGARP